jgi:hypothetical protein
MTDGQTEQINEIEHKAALRFPADVESKLIKAISKVLSPQSTGLSEESAAAMPELAVMDPANVCMVIGISEPARRVLARFVDYEAKAQKSPALEYYPAAVDVETQRACCAKFSGDYLLNILPVLVISGTENKYSTPVINLSVKRDYPVTLSNDHFKIILAPRVESD